MKKIDSSTVTCAIFAGSNGFSIDNMFMSKSLLEIGGKTLLEYTIESVLELKLPEVYVFCDDNVDLYERLISKYKGVKLIVSDNYGSTFDMLQNYISFFDKYILFLYGNAPRPVRQLKDMIAKDEDILVSGFSKSTKANQIYVNNRFIEPPYFIKKSLIFDSPAITWMTFFNSNKEKISYYRDLYPNEFNSEKEFEEYKEYVRRYFY